MKNLSSATPASTLNRFSHLEDKFRQGETLPEGDLKCQVPGGERDYSNLIDSFRTLKSTDETPSDHLAERGVVALDIGGQRSRLSVYDGHEGKGFLYESTSEGGELPTERSQTKFEGNKISVLKVSEDSESALLNELVRQDDGSVVSTITLFTEAF